MMARTDKMMARAVKDKHPAVGQALLATWHRANVPDDHQQGNLVRIHQPPAEAQLAPAGIEKPTFRCTVTATRG
ncbi:hypothetical protein HII36_38495 [Nonomuraea sp. NN258]|uniref:hypothetical protein n=1 Tax=Nonomuraea antri TaxID=2730852 RepID=UPI00156A0A93|nr:hypothetical protein [Nonomuraea antri]NRQ37678.1 hypothetical protein [Nonomuraea antri]